MLRPQGMRSAGHAERGAEPFARSLRGAGLLICWGHATCITTHGSTSARSNHLYPISSRKSVPRPWDAHTTTGRLIRSAKMSFSPPRLPACKLPFLPAREF
eukprot:scaffold47426_cov33-Tisochrysis_lutea.AAC.1